MLRNLIIPSVLAGLISLPFVLPNPMATSTVENAPESAPPMVENRSPFQFASAPTTPSQGNLMLPGTTPHQAAIPVYDEQKNLIGYAPAGIPQNGITAPIPPGIPDYTAAETYFLPGDAHGPDLTAAPIDFVLPIDLTTIFRYDVTIESIRQRWDRVSTTPIANELMGYRVALVTGTNSWDLHGSLTYFFDSYGRCQRITFRGWTGDPTRLVKLLENEGYSKQPSRYAGFYLHRYWGRQKGGLLMKNPTVMYRENRMQQVALVLEMNRPSSNFRLSEDFTSLIRGSE